MEHRNDEERWLKSLNEADSRFTEDGPDKWIYLLRVWTVKENVDSRGQRRTVGLVQDDREVITSEVPLPHTTRWTLKQMSNSSTPQQIPLLWARNTKLKLVYRTQAEQQETENMLPRLMNVDFYCDCESEFGVNDGSILPCVNSSAPDITLL